MARGLYHLYPWGCFGAGHFRHPLFDFLEAVPDARGFLATKKKTQGPREGQNRSGDFEGEIHQIMEVSINGGTPKSSTIWL